MKTVLTVAGSDPSGGAGIQADIKTITAHGLYATSAITALTVQNTLGVSRVEPVPVDLVAQQIDCVVGDIRPDAVKIGMLCNAEIVQAVAQALAHGQAECIVIDPVMISTSGHRLLDQEAVQWMKRKLFPMAQLITPNLPEAEALCGMRVRDEAEMERAARLLSDQTGAAVLLKGGILPRRRTICCFKWGSSLAPGPQGGKFQYAWHRLHAFLCDCLWLSAGAIARGERSGSEGVSHECAACRA